MLDKTGPDPITIPSVAREALEQAKGDVVAATDLMVSQVQANPTLYQPLMDPFLKRACYAAITAACRRTNQSIWHTAQPSAEDQRAGVTALAIGTISSLLDYILPGGLRLGEAERADVMAAFDFYDKQSKDMSQKATWLRLIAQHIPDGKRVKEVMTHARAAELRAQAIRESE